MDKFADAFNTLFSVNPNVFLIGGIVLISIGIILLIICAILVFKDKRKKKQEKSDDLLEQVVDEEIEKSKERINETTPFEEQIVEEPKKEITTEEENKPKETKYVDDIEDENDDNKEKEKPEIKNSKEFIVPELPIKQFDMPKDDIKARNIDKEESSEKISITPTKKKKKKKKKKQNKDAVTTNNNLTIVPGENIIVPIDNSKLNDIKEPIVEIELETVEETSLAGTTPMETPEYEEINDEPEQIIKQEVDIKPLENIELEITTPTKGKDKGIVLEDIEEEIEML